MWSGPRNISTAMMRSFENRLDTAVSDEPFYAAYLASTGLIHPQRHEILESQPRDWRAVVAEITGPVPGGRSVWYQKHMTHHILPGRGPHVDRRPRECFPHPRPRTRAGVLCREARRGDAGRHRPAATGGTLRPGRRPNRPGSGRHRIPRCSGRPGLMSSRALCARLGIRLRPPHAGLARGAPRSATASGRHPGTTLSSARRASRRRAPTESFDDLPDRLKRVAEAGRPFYDRLARYRLG